MTEAFPAVAPLALRLDMARETLARNLSAARGVLGFSQDTLAESAGVSRATIIQLEAAEGDPRLSTLAGIAAALGVSPIVLLLGRDELDAIVNAPSNTEAERVQENISPEELENIRRLLRSGIAKNRAKAVAMGASAATAAGFSAGSLAGAAIGTAILPGVGTAIVAALSAWTVYKLSTEKKGNIMSVRDRTKTMSPDVEIKIRAIKQSFDSGKIDKSGAVLALREAMGAGVIGSVLPSDEEVWTSAEELIKGWDQKGGPTSA